MDQGFDEQCCSDIERCRCPECRAQYFAHERTRRTNESRRVSRQKETER